ncbi:mammalian cell entry protein [Mycobacterium sp. E1747]|uniref:mammalian cell entry protein n=1 Tax=Mycobacterium sp. E1747 TaxID=1834128 RepID=UPI0008013B7A|nr:mammalian cell entry protein [Mycobacterium sp. E1747]OBH09730.1 mammalian cell entry protein [Mycobacterium sp. E1747]
MEDQQPTTGDLTADGSVAESDEAATEERDEAGPAGETASAAESPEADGDAEAAEDQPPARKRRKFLAGKRMAITVAVAAALFVGSAAFAGATVQPYLSDRAAAATKLKVARTAANAITTLWTYTPENMDTLADRASGYLSGDFEAQYRKFVDAIVAPNKQAKITNHTDVTGAAVESIDDANAVVIVYTNTTSTSPLTKNVPSLKYLSYRLFLKRAQSRWLVTRMTTITSLDLTPHV